MLETTGEPIQGGTEDVGEGTDQKENPSHGSGDIQSVSPAHAEPESQQERGHPGAGENQPANQSVSILPRSAHRGVIRSERNSLFIPKDLGALNRDELRTSATFNYSRIMRFLVLVDDVFATLDKLAHEKQQVGFFFLGEK